MSIFEKYRELSNTEFLQGFDFSTVPSVLDINVPLDERSVAVALIVTEAHLTNSAKLVGRSRRVLESFISRNNDLIDLVQDIDNEFLDNVEALHKAAAIRGDLTTQRFFLQTKAKDRGYVPRAEATGKDGGPVELKVHEIRRVIIDPKISQDPSE